MNAGGAGGLALRCGAAPRLSGLAAALIFLAICWLSAPAAWSQAAAQTDGLDLARAARAAAAQGRLEEALQQHARALERVRQQYGPRHEYVAYILDDQATWQFELQRQDQALSLSRLAVELIAEARGVDSLEYAQLLGNQGSLLSGMGRQKEALSAYKGSHAVYVKRVGLRDARTARLARNLGATYLELSRLDEARQSYTEALEATSGAAASADAARAQLGLATVLLRLDALREARTQAEAAQRTVQALPAPAAADVAAVAVTLSELDIRESRLDAADARLREALPRLSSPRADDQLARASVLYNLGSVQILRRQAVESERSYREVLAIYRRYWSPRHPAVGRALHSLAISYQNLGQFEQSEGFYQQAIEILTESFSATDASVAATRLEYSSLLTRMGRPDAGIAEARAALAIFDQLPGAWELKRGYANAVLALAQHRSGDLKQAEQSYLRSLALIEKVAGEQSSDLAPGLTDLAQIRRKTGRLADAEQPLQRAIAIRKRDAATTAEGLAESLSELAWLRLAQGRPADGLTVSRQAVRMAEKRLQDTSQARSAAAQGEQRQARGLYEQFLETAWTVEPRPSAPLLAEMFEVAQLPHLSGTADAVNRMAARFAAGQGRLAKLVRERQDAAENLFAIDRYLLEGLSRSQVRAPSAAEDKDARERMRVLTETLDRLDGELRKQFPQYAELTNPRPIPLAAVQAQLADDEALLLQVTGQRATYVFLVTRKLARFARTDLTAAQLQKAVESLRKGLDLQSVRRLSELPAFDLAAANLLYRQLLGPFAPELEGIRHVIAVVDRAMQNLPLAILVTKPVDAPIRQISDYQRVSFLGRRFALSVVPSASAFSLLRSIGVKSKAVQPFAGFGDPDLEGGRGLTRSSLVDELVTEIDPAMLRQALVPLPETRDELQALSRLLKGDAADLYFRERASVTNVRRVDLSKYRIISFATHGLLAGEFRGLAEPALVLSPPRTPVPNDLGLLTASEIATLRLDADWIILSACNTAAATGQVGAEGLSGLARAFFYAGSRALLVSHWWVASDATTKLMVAIVEAFAADPTIGRAEAVRRGMVRLMDGQSDAIFAHPVFWAAFVNVGEGGRGR